MLVIVYNVSISWFFVLEIYLLSWIGFQTWGSQRKFRNSQLGMHIRYLSRGWSGLSMAWIRPSLTVGFGTDSSVVAKELCQLLPAPFSNIESSQSVAARAAVAMLCNFFSCPFFRSAVDTGDSSTALETVEKRTWAYCVPYYFPFSSKFVSVGAYASIF